jgi:hypothetical protein
MKVTIVSFSGTGNTRIVAEHIAQILLESYGHEAVVFDGLSLLKCTDVLCPRNTVRPPDTLSITGPALEDFRKTLSSTDVFGVGSYVNSTHPAPGISAFFDDDVLHSSLFDKVRFFFTFSTHGSAPSLTTSVLAQLIQKKNRMSVFAGMIDIHAPENVAPLLPPVPHNDRWDLTEFARITSFANELGNYLALPPPRIPRKFFSLAIARVFIGLLHSLIWWITGPMTIDTTKCV